MADLSVQAGVVLDSWQELVLQAAMGERSDATWAAKRVGLSVPRQNGKSVLLVARALAGVLLFGERKIVVSAHQQDTARESFVKLNEIIEAEPNGWVRRRIKPNGVLAALNRETVRFVGGAQIQFKARSGAGSRGFSSDCLLLDEAQILSQRAWVSINSTMSAMPNPQVWLLGTPPTPEDDGAVFASVRSSATQGTSTSVAWLEWAADPAADPADEVTRWSANPAWNTRINHEVVDGEFETYPPERFALDRLGIWPDDLHASRLVDADLWAATGVPAAPAGGVKAFGVAFSLDGTRAAVGGARRNGGDVHVELVDARTGPVDRGVQLLAGWLAARWKDTASIVVSGRAGATVLADALAGLGVPRRLVRVVSTEQYTTACATFYDALVAGQVTHLAAAGQALLDRSVAVCDKKKRGTDGAWGWTATTGDGDETPLEAVSLALWAARTTRRDPGRRTRAVVMT